MIKNTSSKFVPEIRSILVDYMRFRRQMGMLTYTDGDHLHEVVSDIVQEALDEMASDGSLMCTVDQSDGLPRYALTEGVGE